MTKSADPDQVAAWTKQAATAERDRLIRVEAMDIYNTQVHTREFQIHLTDGQVAFPDHLTAPSRATLQTKLIKHEQQTGQSKGVTSWLATGLKIEEAQ